MFAVLETFHSLRDHPLSHVNFVVDSVIYLKLLLAITVKSSILLDVVSWFHKRRE